MEITSMKKREYQYFENAFKIEGKNNQWRRKYKFISRCHGKELNKYTLIITGMLKIQSINVWMCMLMCTGISNFYEKSIKCNWFVARIVFRSNINKNGERRPTASNRHSQKMQNKPFETVTKTSAFTNLHLIKFMPV